MKEPVKIADTTSKDKEAKKPLELNFEGESTSTMIAFFLTNLAFVCVFIPVIIFTILTLFIHVIAPLMLTSTEEFWEEDVEEPFRSFCKELHSLHMIILYFYLVCLTGFEAWVISMSKEDEVMFCSFGRGSTIINCFLIVGFIFLGNYLRYYKRDYSFLLGVVTGLFMSLSMIALAIHRRRDALNPHLKAAYLRKQT